MLVIFWDFDGTIVDTENSYRNMLIKYLKENDLLKKEIDEHYFFKNIAGTHPEEFLKNLHRDGFIKSNNIDPDSIRKAYDTYFDEMKSGDLKINDKIDEIIDNFSKKSDVLMFITSSSSKNGYIYKQRILGDKVLDKTFDINKNVYLCAEKNCRNKPEPDIYIYAYNDVMEKYNLDPSRDKFIIIEDSLSGCQAAYSFKEKVKNIAKVKVVAYMFVSVINKENPLFVENSDIIIEKPEELLEEIKKYHEE